MIFALFLLALVSSISVECAIDDLPRNINTRNQAYPMMDTNFERVENPSFLSKVFGNFLVKSLFNQEDNVEKKKVETEFKQIHSILKVLNKQNDKDFFRF
jgi:hypothetical protein